MTTPVLGVDAAVRHHAKTNPLGVAVLSDQGVLTWADVDQRADWLAHGLRRAGVAPGDHVAWLGRNRTEYVLLAVAARRARASILSLNWRLSAPEIGAMITDSQPKIILLEADLAPLLASAIPDPSDPRLVYLDDTGQNNSFAKLLNTGHEPMPALVPEPGDPLFLYYTSGTTGKPKGVVHGLFASDEAAARHGSVFDWGPESVTLIVAPVFHLTGSVWVQSSLCIGAKQVISASTSAALILSAINRWNVTHTVLVPTMIRMVLDEMRASGAKASSLKVVTYGGAPMTPSLLREAMTTLKCKFIQGYGLTETNSPVTFLVAEDHVLEGPRSNLLNSVGRGYQDIKVRIADTATGEVLGPGAVGEVQISTPWRMTGYRNDPALTASVFTADGWFRTGDGGHLDVEGYLFLSDRINDMIVTGGENVMPSEVENVLMQHSAVSEAAVFAVKDPVWGESICAAVVVRSGAAVTAKDLIQFCRDKLAHYKCPREIVLVETLPRNATGKVLRRELRSRFAKPSA